MSAPNIVNVGTITGKTAYLALANTNATTLVSNAASSGKVFKINTIVVANVDGTNTANISVDLHSEDDGAGTGYALASTIDVTADSTLVVVDKTTSLYLEEDKSIVVTASNGGDLEVTCSYEEIS